MSTALAQVVVLQDETEAPVEPVEVIDGLAPLRDNRWLDQYEFHFGEWIKQIVDWVDINLGWLLDAFIWPFEFLFGLIMNEDDSATSIMSLPWYWVAIVFFLLGAISRNTRIGIMAGALVAACGLLGPDYWSETTKTFGMIFVSVLLCAIIGIPLGVLCGRVDSVWNGVRPVLDAMQVVHSFVYMLPFIFFWGPGEPSATMATLVFALPPLVRLTNLGVRQVPEDVVEASRAFGANEFRVLTDVQLPLARPAIMTGLNQTLLMAISMLGIAAIMGAGGLGKLLLQAISSNNLPQATSAGLAYFFVAVVLDRITQRESADGVGLFGRIREAWSLRRDPEAMLAAQMGRQTAGEAEAIVAEAAVEEEPDERDTPVGASERMGLLVGLGGMAIAAVSAFLTWGRGAGLVAGWGRRADETDLAGQSFMGIEASGGSMFAVFLLGLAFIGLLCAARPLVRVAKSDRVVSGLNRIQGAGIALLMGVGLAVWLFNIFNDDFGGWLDGGEDFYSRIWTVLLLLAGLALGEFVMERVLQRPGIFVGAFAVAVVFAIALGSDRLEALGLVAFAVIALTMLTETFLRGSPRMGADGLTITGLGALALAVGYFMLNESTATVGYSHGIGIWVALVGAAAAVAGGAMALFSAPYTSRIPLKLDIKWGLIGGAAFALLTLLASVVAPWHSDARLDTLMTPELEAEIERLREEAGDDIGKQIANGQAITNLINSAQADPIRFNGTEGDGPGLGWPMLAFAAGAVVTSLLAAGVTAGDELTRWRFGALTAGFGLGAVLIPAAWIFSYTRSASPRAIPGNGAFFAMALAFILFAIGQGVIAHFRRRKIYAELTSSANATARAVDVTDGADGADGAEVLVGGDA